MSANFDAQPQWCECNLIFLLLHSLSSTSSQYTIFIPFSVAHFDTHENKLDRQRKIYAMMIFNFNKSSSQCFSSLLLTFTFVLMQSPVIFMIMSVILGTLSHSTLSMKHHKGHLHFVHFFCLMSMNTFLRISEFKEWGLNAFVVISSTQFS